MKGAGVGVGLQEAQGASPRGGALCPGGCWETLFEGSGERRPLGVVV